MNLIIIGYDEFKKNKMGVCVDDLQSYQYDYHKPVNNTNL